MSENLTTNVELDSTANGTVSFATDVVATIAGLAATEVEGVAAMINNGNLGLVDMLRKNQGNRPLTRGVKVEINGNQVRVQLTVTVDYGSPVPTVAREIQDNVKKAIETMTGLEVPEINIYVQGISFEKENRAAAELEQKQRAALNAAKVERLGHGEEQKSEAKADEKPEEPAAEDAAEGEKKRTWFGLRRREDGKDEETADEKPEASQDDAPAANVEDDEKPADASAEEAMPADEAAPETDADEQDDEDEDVCDGHCDTCTLECDAAGDKGVKADTDSDDEQSQAEPENQ